MEANNKGYDEETVRRRTLLFKQYVVPHVNLVYKLCIQYSFSRNDIQDNYNEVLINFYRYIETYDPSRSLQTWLHIVTKRCVNELNKRNSRIKSKEYANVSELGNWYGFDIEAEPEKSENCMGIENYHELYQDDVLIALYSMKPVYREALLLQQAGYSIEEIMEIAYAKGTLANKNLETVKSRLHLAKKQMRKMINRDGEKRKD